MAKKPTPVPAEFLGMKCNIACEIDHQHDYSDPREMDFNVTTDDGLASRRSKHEIRSYEQLEADTHGRLDAGFGVSIRMRMAGAGENNQFPYTTDEYGKQRS